MKSLKSLLIVLISMVAFVLVFSCRSVYATGGLVLNPGAATSNTANTTANTTTNSVTNVTTNTTRLNTSTTNNINSDVNKDLPQTGETDTYILILLQELVLLL